MNKPAGKAGRRVHQPLDQTLESQEPIKVDVAADRYFSMLRDTGKHPDVRKAAAGNLALAAVKDAKKAPAIILKLQDALGGKVGDRTQRTAAANALGDIALLSSGQSHGMALSALEDASGSFLPEIKGPSSAALKSVKDMLKVTPARFGETRGHGPHAEEED